MAPIESLRGLTRGEDDIPITNIPIDHVIFGLKDGSTFDSYWYLLSSSNPDCDSVNLMDLADTILAALKSELQ